MELTEELFQKIYKLHKEQLKYIDFPNKKLIVTFSGCIGSGKTTLAKHIEEEFKGVRTNHDDIREIINNIINPKTDAEKQQALINYNIYLSNCLSREKNGFVILDASTDREYELLKKFAEKYGYKVFVIRMDLSKNTIVNRINKRGTNIDEILKVFEINYKDFQNSKDKIPANYVITEENNDDIQALFNEIRSFLTNIND